MRQKLAKYIYLKVGQMRKEDVPGVLRELEESQWFSQDRLLELQWSRFKDILQYAWGSIPFYKERFKTAGIEPGDIKSRNDLSAIPILTKGEIRENYDAINSHDGLLTECLSTSGSTAEPLMVFRDRISMAHHRANMFRFRNWYGVDIGSYEATFRGTNFPFKNLMKLRMKDFLLNRQRIHERDLSKKNMWAYHRKMLHQKPATFYGFPTLIERYTEFLEGEGVNPKPYSNLKCIIPTSEMAYPHQVKHWKEFYGVPVAAEYGCSETGIMGIECPQGSWHIPAESCLVEFVPIKSANEKDGACTMVVTDLWNKAMPFIRYDVGDSAVQGEFPCACGRGLPTMKSFLGRIAKLVDLPGGRTIHSLDFYYIFRKASEIRPDGIKEFQIRINKPKDFNILIVPGKDFNGVIMEFLRSKIGYALGKEANLTLKLVDKIEPTKGGKFEKVIFVDQENGSNGR